MKNFDGYLKKKLGNTYVLLSGGGLKSLGDFIGSLLWDNDNKKLKYKSASASDWSDLVTFGANAFKSTAYLPLSGGTLSNSNNVLNIKSSSANSWIYFLSTISDTSANRASVGYYSGLAFVANEKGYQRIGVNDSGTPQYWDNSTGGSGHVFNLIHTGNIGSQSVNYATSAGSATYASYLKGPDNRSTNNTPSWYMSNRGSASLYGEFCQTGGANSDYEYRMTMTPWGDNSGQRPVQMAFNNSGAFLRTSASDSAWNSWNTIIHSGNYTSYCATSGHNHDGRYLRDIELNGTFANNVIPTNLAAGLHRIHRPGTDYISILLGYDYPGDYWLLFFQTSSWITPSIQYRASNCTSWITLLTSLNSSVSGGGSTWGSSITVKINGTETTLTIPSNPNTWRGITDDYTGTSSTISLSLRGGKSMYDVLLNGYATWAGGLSSVLPLLAASGEANEVVFSRDLCNGTESSIGYFEKGIRFRWYSNYINIGNVRGGSSNLWGFCIAYSTSATGNYNVLTRVTTGGDYYVAGNSYSTNFYTTSDARKKQNIHKISDNIKQFEWKETGETSYGFVAQDLEVNHPELVDSNGEYKTVNYNSALSYYMAQLENRVKELENEIKLLKEGKEAI